MSTHPSCRTPLDILGCRMPSQPEIPCRSRNADKRKMDSSRLQSAPRGTLGKPTPCWGRRMSQGRHNQPKTPGCYHYHYRNSICELGHWRPSTLALSPEEFQTLPQVRNYNAAKHGTALCSRSIHKSSPHCSGQDQKRRYTYHFHPNTGRRRKDRYTSHEESRLSTVPTDKTTRATGQLRQRTTS